MEDQATQVFYVPCESEDWRFIEVDHNLTVKEDQAAFINRVADLYGISGFWDHSKMNNNFKDFIDKFNLSVLTAEELMYKLFESIRESLNVNVPTSRRTQNPRQTLVQIDMLFYKLSMTAIYEEFTLRLLSEGIKST